MVCAVTRGRVEWGAWLNPTGFRVIEARFPSALIADSFYFRGNLDGIGDAHYGPLDVINAANAEVLPWP